MSSLTEQDYAVCKENLENCLAGAKVGFICEPFRPIPSSEYQAIHIAQNKVDFKVKDNKGVYIVTPYSSKDIYFKFPAYIANVKMTSKFADEEKAGKEVLTCMIKFKDDELHEKEFVNWLIASRETTSKTGFISPESLEKLGEKTEGLCETGKCDYYTLKSKKGKTVEIFNEKKEVIETLTSSETPIKFMVRGSKSKKAKGKEEKEKDQLVEVQYGWTDGFFERTKDKFADIIIQEFNNPTSAKKIKWVDVAEADPVQYANMIGSHENKTKTTVVYYKRKEDGTIEEPNTLPLIFSDVKNYDTREYTKDKKITTIPANRAEFKMNGRSVPIDQIKTLCSEKKKMFFGYVYLCIKMQAPTKNSFEKTKIKYFVDKFDILEAFDSGMGGGADGLQDRYHETAMKENSGMSETELLLFADKYVKREETSTTKQVEEMPSISVKSSGKKNPKLSSKKEEEEEEEVEKETEKSPVEQTFDETHDDEE
jgi:hypothetical protein